MGLQNATFAECDQALFKSQMAGGVQYEADPVSCAPLAVKRYIVQSEFLRLESSFETIGSRARPNSEGVTGIKRISKRDLKSYLHQTGVVEEKLMQRLLQRDMKHSIVVDDHTWQRPIHSLCETEAMMVISVVHDMISLKSRHVNTAKDSPDYE